MIKVYCDTCVYLDLFLGRKQGFEDWGEFALSFFSKVRQKQYVLVYSDHVIYELKKHIENTKDFDRLLNSINDNFKIKVSTNEDDKKKAKKLSKNNYPGALHLILAKKADCVFLTTRNIKDFEEFKDDYVEIILPKSL